MIEPVFNPFPVLETPRLVLRKITAMDAEEFLFLRSDDTVMKYIDRKRIHSIDEMLDFIDTIDETERGGNGINWAITLKGEDVMIGVICLLNLDRENHRGELGYMLHPAYHRQGIVNEAIAKVMHFAFHTVRLHSLEANINPKNAASAAILEKNGFVQEAYFRENYFFGGKFLDSVIYSILTPLREKA
jgi:ribosomal-protein-alanine N-acetyltransferase